MGAGAGPGGAWEEQEMVHYTCDLCGKPLLLEEDVRYVVKIEVYAAYDPMEVSEGDLDEDYTEQIDELCEELEHSDEQEQEDKVYKTFKFDLCSACHERFMKDPLAARLKRRMRYEQN